MDWQDYVALGIVAITAVLLVRSRVGRRRNGLSKAGGCGCCPAAHGKPPSESVVFHARKGGPSTISVTMK